MSANPSLAVLGGQPRFSAALEVGQFYWPPQRDFERAARDIFARRFYTSQRFAGPLVVEFQQRLQALLGVKHVIAVRNAVGGLIIATHILARRGKVIAPACAGPAGIQALLWANCEPVFCDIDPETQQMSPRSVRRLLEGGGITAILGAHLWGEAALVHDLAALAEAFGAELYFDASSAFGSRVGGVAVGGFGRAEVFSFRAANILNAGEGACIATNDDALAAKFAAMRGDETPSAGAELQSATSRMSEMQAAIGLLSLDAFDRNRDNNALQRRRYVARLAGVPGIRVLGDHSPAAEANFQDLVCVLDPSQFGLGRDQLLAVLRAENVMATKLFDPPHHTAQPSAGASGDGLPHTERAAGSTFQLPIGAKLTEADIDLICDVIEAAHRQSRTIDAALVRVDRDRSQGRS